MRIIFKEDSMLNPFLSFFPEAVLYSKPKTQSNNNLSSIAFAGYAVSYTIVETPFLFRRLAGGSPGFRFARYPRHLCLTMRLSTLLIAAVVYHTVASPIRENDETILFDDGTWDGLSMIFDAPRVTVSVAPAMIIAVTESVVLMAKQDRSCSTV